jgi:hypothetical protein
MIAMREEIKEKGKRKEGKEEILRSKILAIPLYLYTSIPLKNT